MRVVPAATVILVAAAFAAPSRAAAQPPVTSFDELNTRVSVGDTVRVTDADGRRVQGRISELHDTSIIIEDEAGNALTRDSVRLVQRRAKSVGRTALWGLPVGGVAGAALLSSMNHGCDSSDCQGAGALGFVIGGGIGAGGAAIVRAALPARWKDVYRAPGASGSAQIVLAPVITPRQKGLALVYAF